MGLKQQKRASVLRKLHKWPSIVLCLFILVFVVSGVVMNHRELFSGIDVSRRYLLDDYKYSNWNNAAIKSSCQLDSVNILVYGNVGIWLTDTSFKTFSDYNAGFPDGIDNRKIFKVLLTSSGELFAGTLFGLYYFDQDLESWSNLPIPVEDKRIMDLAELNGKLLILSRSYLLEMNVHQHDVDQVRILPPPVNYKNEVGLFKTLWVIHSGEIGGVVGKLFVDITGLVFVFLSITGIIYWLFPKWIRKRKKGSKKIATIRLIRNFSLKWHNRIGVYVFVFLMITTITGMFLRPPLLIAIARAQVSKIPFTMLDDPNPWYDQLRRIHYDKGSKSFFIGTNRGIYFAKESLDQELVPIPGQPPVSVMGINVFEKFDESRLLVGSFSGLYVWDLTTGSVIDYYQPGRAVLANRSGPPLSENMVAGYIKADRGQAYVFDYNRGVEHAPGLEPFGKMHDHVMKKSPMSLWNLALEFHTGRYYSILLGKLYILFIPLFGLTMISILLTGFILWFKFYRRSNTH